MYTGLIKMQEEALVHLFFHCCMKDGKFTGDEVDNVAAKLVAFNLQERLNFKDEMLKYKSYAPQIADEEAYLQYLIGVLKPVSELALFSYCAELCLSDGDLSTGEDILLAKIARLLGITETDSAVLQKLLVQRKVVETEKIF